MFPQDCPYNIHRVTEFQNTQGETGYEAIIREWGRKVGSLIAPPIPLTLHGFAGADEVKFRMQADTIGCTPEAFAESLVNRYKELKTEHKIVRSRNNFETTELKRLAKEVEKRGVLYRLEGFKPKKWEWLCTTNIAAARGLLEKSYPGKLEMLINLESLADPAFKLPY